MAKLQDGNVWISAQVASVDYTKFKSDCILRKLTMSESLSLLISEYVAKSERDQKEILQLEQSFEAANVSEETKEVYGTFATSQGEEFNLVVATHP